MQKVPVAIGLRHRPRLVEVRQMRAGAKMTPASIRAWRLSRGMTLAEASAAVGVTLSCWHRWENGSRPAPWMLGLALAAKDAGLEPLD